MRWRNKFFGILFFLTFLSESVFAQAGEVVTSPLLDNIPRFFICIVAGVLLAIGFQVLLTTLSVATGISAIGNVKKKAYHSLYGPSDKNKEKSSTPTVVKISSGLGVWTVITCSISLFFASWLAVKLSLVGVNFIGVTLGLVIWAAFFTAMIYLEVKVVSSLVGGLVNTVMSGLKTSYNAVSSVAGGILDQSSESEAKSIAKTSARENARAMRKELEKLFDRHDVDRKLDDYIERLSPQDIDVHRIRKELQDLITDIEIKEKTSLGEQGITKQFFLDTAKSTPNITKEDMGKLSGVFDQIKGITKSDFSNQRKVEMAVEQFTSADHGDVENFKQKVTQYLRATKKEELQPERIRKDIQAIFENPKRAKNILGGKTSVLDHDTIVNILAAREDVSRQDAEKYAQYAEKALTYVKDHLNIDNGMSSDGEGYREADIRIERKNLGDVEVMESEKHSVGGTDKAKARLQQYLSGLQSQKDFDLNQIKRDFMNMFRSSGEDSESIIYKLKHYNKDQLLTMVSANTNIPRDKAERIVEIAEEARNKVLNAADEVRREVTLVIDRAEEEVFEQAENTRKAAASAAWWLFATAVFSGIASAIGGLLALDSWIF